MRLQVLVSVLLVLLGCSLVLPRSAAADELPIVRAVLFWDRSCPHCEEVLEKVLPPVEQRFGPRFDLVLAEMSSITAYDKYFAVVDHYNLPQARQGVPLLVIGDQVFVGPVEIGDHLVAEIERGLADGGEDFLPALAMTPADLAVLDRHSREMWREAHPGDPLANGLAVAILGFMVLSLIWAMVMIGRAWPGVLGSGRLAALPVTSIWVPLLALGGLAVAGYLSYVKVSAAETVCPIGRCEAVQHSAYATLAGVPVSVLGMATYLLILGLWAMARFGGQAGPLRLLLGVSLFGTAFSAYLTYLEPFVIEAVCIWCLASAVLMTVIMILVVRTVTAGRVTPRKWWAEAPA